MNIDRRKFFAALGLTAVAGMARRANAAGELNSVRGRTFVAACPPVKASIPRTPGPYRIMVIGGHPDDADIICGCTAAKLIKKGCRVKFVARHCTFSGCSAVSFEAGGRSEISNCLFEGGETGVCALLSLDTIVEKCVFRNLSARGVEHRQSDSTDIVGNVFENCPYGVLFSISKNCRLIGNFYSGCKPYHAVREGKSNTIIHPCVINEKP